MNGKTRLEDRIELYHARLEKSDERLSHNWAAQVVLVCLSIYSIVDSDALQSVAAKQFGFPASLEALRGIISALLLYNFMRFGFLLSAFGNMRSACSRLHERILKETDESDDAEFTRLFDTANFFEPLYQPEERRRYIVSLVILVASLVLALSHTCVVIHLSLIVGNRWVGLVGILVFVALLPFYIGFYYSHVTQRHPGVKRVLWASPALAAVLSIVWLLFGAPGQPVPPSAC